MCAHVNLQLKIVPQKMHYLPLFENCLIKSTLALNIEMTQPLLMKNKLYL